MSKTAEEATGPAEYTNVLQYIHVSGKFYHSECPILECPHLDVGLMKI